MGCVGRRSSHFLANRSFADTQASSLTLVNFACDSAAPRPSVFKSSPAFGPRRLDSSEANRPDRTYLTLPQHLPYEALNLSEPIALLAEGRCALIAMQHE